MTIYAVGPTRTLTSITQVPWENLVAGDTVTFDYTATPYKGKFAINAYGTVSAPVVIKGLPGPNGELPIIDANGATTRPTMNFGRDSASLVNQGRSTCIIVTKGVESGINQPTYIEIRNLKFVNNYHTSSFTDSTGHTQTYSDFGSAIWIDAGHNITIDNCAFDSNVQAIFSKSIDGGDATVTKNLAITNCHFTNNGLAGGETLHTCYIQTDQVLIEGNYFESMRADAGGNAVKSRSIGEVYRYNYIKCGTYAFDLVEAADYPDYASQHPDYRISHVYGNIIDTTSVLGIHYGGDVGDSRHGTLWFWDNTCVFHGNGSDTVVYAFKITSTDERVEAFNNIFAYADSLEFKCFRIQQDGPPNPGGILNLGVNWISNGWSDTDPYHAVGGQLLGANNLIVGTTWPIDSTYTPFGAALGVAQAGISGYPVSNQLDVSTLDIEARAGVSNLGAVESNGPSVTPTSTPVPSHTRTPAVSSTPSNTPTKSGVVPSPTPSSSAVPPTPTPSTTNTKPVVSSTPVGSQTRTPHVTTSQTRTPHVTVSPTRTPHVTVSPTRTPHVTPTPFIGNVKISQGTVFKMFDSSIPVSVDYVTTGGSSAEKAGGHWRLTQGTIVFDFPTAKPLTWTILT